MWHATIHLKEGGGSVTGYLLCDPQVYSSSSGPESQITTPGKELSLPKTLESRSQSG